MTQLRQSDSPSRTISRRTALGTTAAAAAAAVGVSTGTKAQGEDAAFVEDIYETIKLAKDSVDCACVRNSVLPVDPADPRPGINRNLKRMVTLIDEHAHWAGPADLLSFHELPIAGHAGWTGEEMLAVSIDLPGKETEVLAAKAREYDMWLMFGCYARIPDQPNQAHRLDVVIDPHGHIVAKHATEKRWADLDQNMGIHDEIVRTTLPFAAQRFHSGGRWR